MSALHVRDHTNFIARSFAKEVCINSCFHTFAIGHAGLVLGLSALLEYLEMISQDSQELFFLDLYRFLFLSRWTVCRVPLQSKYNYLYIVIHSVNRFSSPNGDSFHYAVSFAHFWIGNGSRRLCIFAYLTHLHRGLTWSV